MPHPEINQASVTTHESRLKLSPSWAPHVVHVATNVELVTAEGYWEKESSNNPVRENGTRAISSHWIKRFRCASPPSTFQSEPVEGYDTWFCPAASPCPRAGELSYTDLKGNVDLVVGAFPYSVEANARINFLTKLEGAKGTKLDLGVATGEFRETIGMVAALAGGIVSTAKNISRNLRVGESQVDKVLKYYSTYPHRRMPTQYRQQLLGSGKTQIPEKIVDSWLVYQFGVKPLISDITAASALLQAKLVDGKSDLGLTVRSGNEATDRREVLLCGDGLTGGFYSVVGVFEILSRCLFSARYEIPTTQDLTRNLGFQNQASVLWNLCLYSWMADYATNTGKWLSSMSATTGTKFLEGTVSKVQKANCVEVMVKPTSNPNVHVNVVQKPDGPFLCEADYFRREILSPVGILPPPTPTLKNELGLTQLANVLAVLKNFVR